MCLKNRRFLIFLLSSLAYFAVRSQTLYWIGGNGNFNDPKHWSETPGGTPVKVSPGPSSDLIFDYIGSPSELKIFFDTLTEVHSLSIRSLDKIRFVKRFNSARLVLSEKFDNMYYNKEFASDVVLEFNNKTSGSYGFINTGTQKLTADVIIRSGKWKITMLNLAPDQTLFIHNSDIDFDRSGVDVGHLDLYNCGFLNFDHAILKVRNEFKVKKCDNYSFKKSSINLKMYDDAYPEQVGLSTIAERKGSFNQINTACISTTLVSPSCSPGCDGQLIITLPPVSCYTSVAAVLPYDIVVDNSGCPGSPPSILGAGPGTYTIGGFCVCTYPTYVFDANGFQLEAFTVGFLPPAILSGAPPPSTSTITCGGACTGSININYSNGSSSPAYIHTITPPGGASYTTASTGALTLTGLCAGTLSVITVDQNLCINTFVRNFTAPLPLNTNSVLANIPCNAICNGSLSITPSGGTANYTVNFSTGAIVPVAAGNTASVTGLCAGPVSATLTDVRSCTTTVSGVVTQPPTLVLTTNQMSVSCYGACTGSAGISASGGTTPYSFTVTPSVGSPSVFTSVTSISLTNLCGGTYTVDLRDNNNCTTVQTFTINQPPAFNATPTVTNVTCNGGTCDGRIVIATSGGNGAPYTYTWAPTTPTITGQGTATVSNLCPNNYTLTVRDASACPITSVIAITQPPPMTVTAVSSSVSCFGSCNGSATVTAAGGNGTPFSFTWTPNPPAGQGTAIISSLCGGSAYTATVRDASNCAVTVSVSIIAAPPIVPNITTGNVTCNAACNGSISAAPSGTATFNYTLASSSSTITSPPPYTGLCANTYTLFVKDMSTGCTQPFVQTITQPNVLVASINITTITCFGLCNGSLGSNISGGTPNYTVNWTTPGGPASASLITNQCAGAYVLNVTDVNSCTATATATLVSPTDITISIASASVSCSGGCNGALTAAVSGGTPTYALVWSNGPTSNPNINLCAGTYTLNVTDANFCTKTATQSVIAPTVITLSQATTAVSCAGGSNGSATVTAAGGNPPYLFQFNDAATTTNTTGVVGGLPAGVYIANVTDVTGCPRSISFTITAPPALSAAITGFANSCNVCTGTATVSASGGTLPYAPPVWTNSLGAVVGNGFSVGGLCPGDYTVTVTDNGLCTITTTVHISLTVNISVLANGAGIACFGACTGTAFATPSGGQAPYSFLWSAGSQTNSVATGLCAGVHTVTVTDLPGCVSVATVNIAQPSSVTATSSQTNATCFGTCNGIINSSISGGTTPYTYSLNGVSTPTTHFTGLCAGTYTLQIRDNNLCPLTLPVFTITQNAPITATLVPTNPSACAGTGSICAAVSGGTGGPYTYSWSPVAGAASCLTNLVAGSYTLTVLDGTCSAIFSTVVTNPTGPSLATNIQTIACFGASTGAATVTASGAGPFTFTWSPAVPTTTTGTTAIISGVPTGTYMISAADVNSCVTTQAAVIAQSPSITVNQAVSNAKCNGTSTGSITVAPSGGTPGYNYSWLPAGLPGGTTGTVTSLPAGDYTVTVTDAAPCSSTYTFHVSEPAALALSTTSSNVTCNSACNGSVVASASGGLGVLNYSWAPVGTFTGATTSTLLNLCPNIYSLTVTDVNLCTISTTVQITEPTALTSTLILQQATCSNSCNAIAVHLVSGGTPGYNYSWSAGTNTTSTLAGLCVGNYTGTVTDANGCVVAKGFTVALPTPFSLSLAGSDPKCNSACNGSVTTTPSGGVGTITYSWFPAGTGQNPTGLCFGPYTLTAVDANSCQASAVISLNNPPALLANVSTTNAACAASCNGAAFSSPANAVGAVTYSWMPSGPNAPSNTGLCSGTYTLQITDGNNCQDVQTFTLVDPPSLVVNPSTIPSTCSFSNGAISATVIGGTPAYSYNWLAPVSSTNSSVSGLAAGIYTLVVTDANSCTNTVTIPLSNSNGPSFAPIISTSLNCNAQCTGAASVDISGIVGGTPGYAVAWLPPAPSFANPITNLCAGNYTAQITDANNCILFQGVNIAEPPPLLLAPTFGLPTCNGTCDGSISLNPSGGVGPTYTYTWLPSGPSGPSITNACAGSYTILVGDNGCVYPQNVILPAQLNISVSTSIVPNQCFGDCNGSATAFNAVGGVAPYVYNWSNGQSGPTATGLCNGTYSVTVTDANGCFNTFSVLINSASQITYTTAITSPSCGLCNGASTITASGGIAPYSYTWTTGASLPNVTGLCAGIYQVAIVDGIGCSTTETVIINNSTGITGETFSTQPLPCSGACNAAATVTAIGGTAPITYNWLSPATAGQSLTNLCAGTYFVQMTDAVGCRRTSSVTIDPVTSLTLSPFITPPSCNTSNGAIDVLIAGGTLPYTISWNPPAGTTATLTNIGAGSYTITVTESGPNNCSVSQQINVSNTSGPTVTATQADIACFGTCTGSIAAIATGTAPFTYNWNTGGTSPNLTGLCQGVITLTVTDVNTCVTINSYTINENTQLQAALPTVTQPSCGLCNGSANLNVIGGVLPYTYTWTTGATGPVTSSLCAGLYQVQVTDNVGCQQTQTVTINNSNGITGEIFTVQDLPCNGTCNGSASVTALGGTAPYNYNWLSPAVSGSVSSGLCAGIYFVQMSDAQGCIRTSSVSVAAATVLSLTPTIVQPGCMLNDGSLSVLISGGTPSYAVSWNPPIGTTATLTNIGAGSYTITVTESGPNNCSISQVFNVSNTAGPIIAATQTDVACFGSCTGAITAVATGTAPFSYNWNVGGSTPSITNLCKGAITLTVTDANSCVTIDSYTINENPQLTIGLPIVTQPSCNLCNGAASINALGGVLPYTYTWTTGATGPVTSSLCAGLYQVKITDNLGCQQTETVIINNSTGITGETFNVQGLPCNGTCNGSASVTPIGGTAPYNYSWVSPASTNSTVSGLCAGTYFVQMSDAQGCIRTSSVDVAAVTVLSLTPSVVQPGCMLNNGSLSVLIAGGTPSYAVSWNPPIGTTATLSNIGAGSYTVTVTESGPNTCSLSQAFNVSNTSGPTIAATQTDIACFGSCTGVITAVASGTAPFSYNWSNGHNTPSINGLCKGVITLSVTDANTCVTVDSYTINENPQLQAGIPTVAQPSCGLCNGVANLTAFGGTLPYTYTWTTGASGPSTSSLCAGLYQVQITDNVGCQQTETVIINNSNGITGETFSVQGLPCNGNCNGSASVTATGGTAPYNYSWISPAVSGSVASGLCAGDYFVQMSDAQGCLRTASVNVAAVTVLSITASVIEPGCALNNGSASVLISGGTPSYAISWAPVAGSTATITNIGAGSYTVTVTESGPNSCSLSQQVNVSNTTGPVVATTQTDIACFGNCNGAITAVATGTAPFSYNWNVGGNMPAITNLCKGVITLSVTDGNNCVTIDSYTINENPPLQTGLPLVTQPGCNQCNGTAMVTALGGTLPYTYVWTTGGTGPGVSSLCAGLYQVQITDNAGCQQTQNVIINNATGITAETFNVQDETCAGNCNGSLTVTATGGAAPIIYNWISPVISSSVITNLCGGNYFVQMTDANGCIRTASTSVNSATSLTLAPAIVQPSCNTTNGSIDMAVTGGVLPYTFSWSTGANTSSVTGIGAGSYTVTVSDANGCSKMQVFTINNSVSPAITFTQNNIACFNACTGALTALATGSAASFSYNWSTGSTAPNISGLCKGLVTLTVTGSDGCIAIRSFTLTDNPALSLSLPNLVSPNCFGGCNGAITLIPSGGSLPYTYSWVPSGSSNPQTGLCAGNYSVTITDALGCANAETVTLNNPLPLQVSASFTNSSCSNMADGSVSVSVTGGTPAYTFTWTGPGAFTSTLQSLGSLIAGTYSLNLTDNSGCTGDTVLVLAPTITITANAGRDTSICSTGSITLDGINSQGAVQFNWFQIPGTTTVASTASFVVPGAIGSATYELLTVASVTGCVARDTVVVNIFPVMVMDAGPDVIIPVFSTVTLGGNPTAPGAVSLTWTPAFSLSDGFIQNPVASNTVTTVYTVTAVDANGCFASDTVKVELFPEVKIPNGFSPNADGRNDSWIIDYIDQFPNNTVEVYNRWGEQLFYSKGYSTPFNGTYKGKDLPVGTYYYIIHLNHPAYTKPYTGPLTIFR